MAIEITYFAHTTISEDDIAANAEEVLTWLRANATDYFPGGFETTGSAGARKILCKNSNNDAMLAIPFCQGNDGSDGFVKSKHYSGYAIWHGTGRYCPFRKAVKTSYGIALVDAASGESWFISKTNGGETCFAGICDVTNGASTYAAKFLLLDTENSVTYVTVGADMSGSTAIVNLKNAIRSVRTASKAILAPLAFDCGSYTENLFYVPFTPLQVDTGIQRVMMDGTEYVYDGVLALKG